MTDYQHPPYIGPHKATFAVSDGLPKVTCSCGWHHRDVSRSRCSTAFMAHATEAKKERSS